MHVQDLVDLSDATVLCGQNLVDQALSCGYACDLLSWVMARGEPGMAWITVQTHLNVVAVASLHEMACILLPEGLTMAEEVLAKARAEGITVLSSPHNAYTLAGRMFVAGLPSPSGF